MRFLALSLHLVLAFAMLPWGAYAAPYGRTAPGPAPGQIAAAAALAETPQARPAAAEAGIAVVQATLRCRGPALPATACGADIALPPPQPRLPGYGGRARLAPAGAWTGEGHVPPGPDQPPKSA